MDVSVKRMSVSTLLEILAPLFSIHIIDTPRFQPFLRFYREYRARSGGDSSARKFQPFLRFYQGVDLWRYADLVAEMFQPFLRFYHSTCRRSLGAP